MWKISNGDGRLGASSAWRIARPASSPRTARPRLDGVVAMTVSWEDAGRAMRHALEAPSLPSPFEIFHILADLPHGKFSNTKAKRLLGWQPRDSLVELWGRRQ